jgi:hypothetical protein
MTHPREAVFDVLKSKHLKGVDARLKGAKAEKMDDDWSRYQQGNEAAKHAYNGRRRG